MSEVIDFLMLETEKQEHLIEEVLENDLNGDGALADLQRIVQSTYKLYSSVEQLRESHSQWVLIHSNRVYDAIKGLISLKCLPDPYFGVGLPNKAGDAVIAGYLYVIHVFQIHTHGFGNTFPHLSDLDGSLHRLFCSSQQDLVIRRQFLEKVRSNFNEVHYGDLASGVQLAFYEIGTLLQKKSHR